MGQSRRIRIVDIFALLALIAILAAMFFPAFNGIGEQQRRTKCTNILRSLGTAFWQYMNAYGGDSLLPVPATQFRGDTWLCVLYWKGLFSDKRMLVCPSTADSAEQLPDPGRNCQGYPISFAQFGESGTIGSNQVSYCGRTNMSGIRNVAQTETSWFNEKAFRGSPLMCDKPGNHDDVINAVFSDGHVDPLPDAARFVGDKTQTGGTDVMRTLQYMDNGDP